MFIILNRANLVVAISGAVAYVRQEGGRPVLSDVETASALYAADEDTFYPTTAPTTWNGEHYRAEEVEAVPDEVVPGFWYYDAGEFFTTPEKEAEFAEWQAQKDAAVATSIVFVTLAESGQIDDVTATEHASQFEEWAYPIDYKAGQIRRDPLNGSLYRVNEGQGHTSQEGWNPSLTPALWTKVGDPGEEWPEWAQPIGAQDAYKAGDKVTHNGVKWISTVDANTWEPGVYGWEAAEA